MRISGIDLGKTLDLIVLSYSSQHQCKRIIETNS